MSENTDFTNYLNEQISTLAEEESTTQEEITTEENSDLEITEDEVVVGDGDASSNETTVITETYEIIAIDPEVLYEKIDNINTGVGFIGLLIAIYICWEFLGKFFHIRKEGDL